MRDYELVYVVKPVLDDETREGVQNRIKEIIEANGGEVTKVDALGNRKLAYPIDKFTEGFYTLVNFKASVAFPNELDRKWKLNENVLRHMEGVWDSSYVL